MSEPRTVDEAKREIKKRNKRHLILDGKLKHAMEAVELFRAAIRDNNRKIGVLKAWIKEQEKVR